MKFPNEPGFDRCDMSDVVKIEYSSTDRIDVQIVAITGNDGRTFIQPHEHIDAQLPFDAAEFGVIESAEHALRSRLICLRAAGKVRAAGTQFNDDPRLENLDEVVEHAKCELAVVGLMLAKRKAEAESLGVKLAPPIERTPMTPQEMTLHLNEGLRKACPIPEKSMPEVYYDGELYDRQRVYLKAKSNAFND